MFSASPAVLSALRTLHRAPEPDVLGTLLPAATLEPTARERVVAHSMGLLGDLRTAQREGWVNQFLQQYRLNSSEGVALLSHADRGRFVAGGRRHRFVTTCGTRPASRSPIPS